MINEQTFQLPSPQTTLVILLGASQWPRDPNDFPSHPAFKEAAKKVYQYFVQSFGVPRTQVLQLFDTKLNASDIDEQIRDHIEKFKEKARDVIIYYIGRGKQTTANNQLYLAIRTTRADNPEGTSLQIASLAKTILGQARTIRRFYIFDCDSAARAIPDLQAITTENSMYSSIAEAERGIQGYTGLFTSDLPETSGLAKDPALLPDSTNTFFTEALLYVLAENNSGRPLSFNEISAGINSITSRLYEHYRLSYPEIQRPPKIQMYPGDIKNIPILPKRNPSAEYIPLPPPVISKGIAPLQRPRLPALAIIALLLLLVISGSFLYAYTSGHTSVPRPRTAITSNANAIPANFTAFSNSDFSLDYPRDWTHVQNNTSFSFARSDNVTEFIVSVNTNAQNSNATINALTGDILSCTQQKAQTLSSVVVNNKTWQQSAWNCFLASSFYVVHLLTYVDSQTQRGTAILYAGWQQVFSSKLINFDQANTQYFQPMLQSFQLK